MKKIATLSSKVVYQNNWMTVREDDIKRANGSKGLYGIVEKPDFVVIIPIHEGHIHIVEQYRYPLKKRYWELPQGSYEKGLDTCYEDSAKRELYEETGLVSRDMHYIGKQFLACGYSNQAYHIYLAKDLKQSTNQLDIEEADLVTKKVPLVFFEEMISLQTIMDATTTNAYLLAKFKKFI